MAYQVTARKWRPQTFSELVGQQHIIQTLLNALRNKRLHHSILLTGPRGTGKTSSARILAKSVRCPHAKDFVPCNTCRDCTDIANGRSLDVQEIDGASNNGVDAVRELRDGVGYMPSSGQYKLYIIDEVHMLSTSAFNALLKTLEEPPAHVIFILATTEVQKIPNTILSRCQRFDFRLLPTRQITERLKYICTQEKVTIDDEALWAIARQSEGSVRDSLSLLDQVITFCSEDVTYESVTRVLGLTDRVLLLKSVEALCTRNVDNILSVIESISQSGHDPKIFAQDLLEELRHLLMVRIYSQHAEKVVDLPDSEIQLLTQISENLNEEDIHLLFDMALKGGQDLMKAHDPRLVLEMVLLRMAQAPRIRELAARTSESHLSHSEKKPISNRPSVPPLAMSSTRPLQTKAEPTAHTLSVAQKSEIEKEESQEAMQTPQKSLFQENLTPQANWTLLVEQIKKHDPRIGAKLENVCLIEMTDRGLVLGVTESLRFLFDQLREPGFIKTLESDIIKFWEKPYSVSFTIYNPQKNTQTMSPKAAKEKEDTVKETSLREQVLKSDLVQKTQRVFNAEIEAIKEI